MKKIVLCLVVYCAQFAGARVINVAEHGVIPGNDATYQLNKLIESVQNEPDVTLSFPKGQYNFYAENAKEMYRAVANHDNGLKRMIFPLFNNKNITIDGNGSLFMMHGRVVPFTLERVQGATLKNFSIDWIRAFHAELKVVESDAENNSFVVSIDSKLYPYTLKGGELLFDRYDQMDPIGANMTWDPATRSPIYDTQEFQVNGEKAKITKAGDDLLKFTKSSKQALPVGSVLVAYGVHPTSRLCPAIHVTNSKDLRIENVTVYDAGGMALIVERTDNITLNGMKVTSTKDRIVSTRADATHFIGCKGAILVENCILEHMLDDGINVHGAYVPVSEYLGDNQFLCEISHFQQWGLTFGEAGDKIALLSRSTVLPFYETTITSIKTLNEHRFILTVESTPKTLPEGLLSVENMTWYPSLTMRNNKIRENRARSVLVTTKGSVLIENNYFNSQMHGILIEGDNNKWYESGAVQDVTIRNNTFDNIGFACSQRYPLLASPLLRPEQYLGEGQYHRNINFTGNTIRSFNGLLANARSVKGLNVSDNTIEFSSDYPAIDEGPAVVLEYCDNVTLKGNSVTGFAKAFEIKAIDCTDLTAKENSGFVSQ